MGLGAVSPKLDCADVMSLPADCGDFRTMTDSPDELNRLEKSASTTPDRRQPVDKGHFDIRIDKDGQWFHQGGRFTRLALARLFATVLKRDADGVYWLETPVERGRIDVDDAPFVAVELEATGAGQDQSIRFRDTLETWTTLDAAHPLRIEFDPASNEPRPYLLVRDGLEARIARAAFYELVDLAEETDDDLLYVWSGGVRHELGNAAEA